MNEKLSFKEHIHDKINNKSYAMLGLIKRIFTHLATSNLYKNMVRSHLEYCNLVWSYRDPDFLI